MTKIFLGHPTVIQKDSQGHIDRSLVAEWYKTGHMLFTML